MGKHRRSRKENKPKKGITKEEEVSVGEQRKRDVQGVTVTCDDGSCRVPPPLPLWDDNSTEKEDEKWALFRQTFVRMARKKKCQRLVPTPIQLQMWSLLCHNKQKRQNSKQNLICIAPTGSGKTLSYGLPMVSSSSSVEEWMQAREDSAHHHLTSIFGLVLVPTRELAIQVAAELNTVCRLAQQQTTERCLMRAVAIYGGMEKEHQWSLISNDKEKNVQNLFLSATPGRLLDMLSDESSEDNDSSRCNSSRLRSLLSRSKYLVVDEADRMALNTDIAQQVDSILEIIKSQEDRTICLVSATYPQSVTQKWNHWLPQPSVCIKVDTVKIGEEVSVGQDEKVTARPDPSEEEASPDNCDNGSKRKQRGPVDVAHIPSHITQILHVCAEHKKPRKLLGTLKKIRQNAETKARRRRALCLIFFGRIKTLQYIFKLLEKEGYACAELHSHMTQQKREQTLLNFKAGKVPTLLATDIAARGVHVNNVEYVINYDFPGSVEQYVHRCGRTGRNKASQEADGVAMVYSFFTRNFAPMASDVVALLRSSNAWVDPNLLELMVDKKSNSDSPSKQKRKKEEHVKDHKAASAHNKASAQQAAEGEMEDWDDGQFSALSGSRIVLKRASHVSDTSDSEGDENG